MLCQQTTPRLLCRSVFYCHFPSIDTDIHIEVLSLDVFGIAPRGDHPISPVEDCTLVVSVQNVLFNLVSLCFNEVNPGEHLEEDIVQPYQIAFGRDLPLDLLLPGFTTTDFALPERLHGFCLSLSVFVHCILRANPLHYHQQILYVQSGFHYLRFL